MDHWIKVKGNAINLSKIGTLRCREITKEMRKYENIEKGKQWLVEADYTELDAFKTKTEANNFIDDILDGKYDHKKKGM